MSAPLDIAQQVVRDEAAALARLAESLGGEFERVLQTIHESAEGVIVSGIGKSGNIAQKIAASLTSTGTRAVFMHPVEALHGDLGIVTERHCLIALSRSGNTEELLRLVVHFRRLGGPVIGMTQPRDSPLAELLQQLLLLPDLPEAGPLALAPTTSTIMMLAAGDALAMALLEKRGFAAEDFAQYHPEGTLGRRLLLRAGDLMHAGEALPRVSAGDTFDALLLEMTRKHLGLALIVEGDGRLLGVFTDGDLRRLLERERDPRRLNVRAAHAASRRASTEPAVRISAVKPAHLAVECVRIMRAGEITSLVVTDDAGAPVGILRLMDLVRAGVA